MSVKAGYGHHSTAQAVIDCLGERGIESCMLDTFDYIDPMLCETIDKGYLFSTKNFPEVYGKAYAWLDKRVEPYKRFSPISVVSKLVSHKLRDYITDYAPDVIIGTHSFACMVITYLKEKGTISCPTVGIVTDFTVHPFWESTDMDYYVTADSLLDNQMRKKGIPKEKILPFGIPINKKFLSKIPRKEARKSLGIADKTTILLMMGSMGFGNIEKQIEAITKIDIDMQVLCVCGRNEKIKKEIDAHGEWEDKIITYGFVDNVDVLMDAADCIITKPGGLTTSELLAKRLPAIIMNPIPGQEDRNMEFLVNNGAAITATDTFGVDEALFELFSHPWRLRLLKLSVSRLGKPRSTVTLCDFLENLIKEKKGH
ncbi:MAG: galactosyldiacylglycerol synthase [Clostridia bacterium]|nr:galactosyldiacylglycerol synthase [Clostridia bacterium]